MTERESRAEASNRRELRGALRCAIVGALLLLAPLAFVGPPLDLLAFAGAALLLVYAGLLWIFGLRAVVEVGLLVFFVSVSIAAGLRAVAEKQRREAERREPAPSVPREGT